MSNIRYATTDDFPRLADIYNQYLGKATLDTEPRDAAFFQKIMDGDRESLLVIESEDLIAGYGAVKKYSWKEGYRFASETSVFLDERHISKGLGKQLKNAVIKEAKSLGYRHLVARIMAQNEGSIQYNLNLGYELVGIQKKIGFANGKWYDVAILQLVLEE